MAAARTTQIDSLPEEILITIFMSILGNEDAKIPHLRTTLALTSKEWHRIIYDTSSFWMKIHDSHTDSQIALALLQSREAPLDVRIPVYGTRINPGPGATREGCFREVCRHLSRWRVAHLTLHDEAPWNDLLSPAPILEDINIIGLGRGSLQGQTPSNLFQGQAPRIKSLALTSLAISWNSSTFFNLSSLKLKSLDSTCPNIEDIMVILRASPQLTILHLSSIEFRATRALPVPVPLPHLQTLELGAIEPSIMGYLLNSIQSPPCQRLVVDCRFNLSLREGPGDLSHLARLPYFFPLVPEDAGSVVVNVVQADITYAFPSEYPQVCFLALSDYPPDVLLRFLTSILPPEYLALDTKLHLSKTWSGAPMYDLRPIAEAADAMRVTTWTTPGIEVRGDKIGQFIEQLSTTRGGHWMLPHLQNLTLDLQDAPPHLLVKMVKARYGVSPTNVEAIDLPAPFTRLKILYARPDHGMYQYAVQRVVGAECLVWKDREPRLATVMVW